MSEEKGIWIITETSEEAVELEEGGTKGSGGGYEDDPYPSDEVELPTSHRQRTRLKSEDLKKNMGEFLEVVEEAFEKAEKPQSRMRLEELELSVEINGEGKVSLLGNGGKAGAKGAITLKFKRRDG